MTDFGGREIAGRDVGTQLFVIGVVKFRLRDSGQGTFAAGEIQYGAFKLVRLFIDQLKSVKSSGRE
jgi:hypothetical protein